MQNLYICEIEVKQDLRANNKKHFMSSVGEMKNDTDAQEFHNKHLQIVVYSRHYGFMKKVCWDRSWCLEVTYDHETKGNIFMQYLFGAVLRHTSMLKNCSSVL